MNIKLAAVAAVSALAVAGCGSQPQAAPQPRTPQVCLVALNLADQGFTLAQQGFQAVAENNPAALAEHAKQMNDLAPRYRLAKQECQARR